MAASMTAMMASTSGLGSLMLSGGSKVNLTSSRSVARAPAFVGRSGVIRCDISDGFRGVKQAVDKATKTTLTRESIEAHQERKGFSEQDSLEASVLGEKADGPNPAPFPRPEVERRPETGPTDIGSIFAFDGAGPETFNGRLAMVGLVWAFLAERVSGLTVAEQLYSAAGGFGLVNFFGVVQLITFASIIPFLNKESTDARSFGPFNARAERWNGRLAMLGFLSLVVTEQITHSPVFANWFSFASQCAPPS